jgi:acetylornithine deacetylase/succinyl-diaminopimelate desuccinylase-like protein
VTERRTAADEVVELCRDLIRIDTSNPGDHSGPCERTAAEYVAEKLAEVGLEPQIFESHAKRASVVARIEGEDASRDALLVHGHLDVVPARAADWEVDPFSGEIEGDCLWGRGAVGMKDMDAMILAVVRQRLREGRRPPRDIVLAFLADEEATGGYGSRYIVDAHREFFEGCTEAISESGGFSVTAADGTRVYPVATGERGTAWLRLTAHGVAGHGAKPAKDNAVAELCHALSRLASHEWPVRLTPAVRALLDGIARALGTTIDHDRLDAEVARLGRIGTLFAATIRNSANPTMLDAGYKVNVIPGTASAQVDGRFLPGLGEEFLATVDRLLGPKITREFVVYEEAVAADPGGQTFGALCAALRAEDPAAHPVPYVMSGGTDAKAFASIGIHGFGFAPLRLEPELDYFGMFHGVDERVPLTGLAFGVRVLDRLLLETVVDSDA